MRYYKNLMLLLIITCSTISCSNDDDTDAITSSTNDINDFVWKGMNLFYLYKDNVPDLANNRFSNNDAYLSYLNNFSTPNDLFEDLKYEPQRVDRFSRIFPDFIALEQLLSGIFLTNGMEFQTFAFSTTDFNRYGVVTHVLPDSNAEAQGIKRGDIFYAINGIPLTSQNRFQLTRENDYTINFGTYNNNDTPNDNTDDFIDETSEAIPLSKTRYSENPIFINKILNVDNKKVGYLMYNAFTDEYDSQLNNTFDLFKNANVKELVLDLRYNSGGAVNSAILLSALITGQFTGEIFSTEEWNSEAQAFFKENNPESLINRFPDRLNDSPINSLKLTKVYILTSRSSASASELVISCLRPYIQVVQIGTNTSGKYQASRIVYNSPNFNRAGANPGHTYAMLPLIFKSLNADGFTDYFDGLIPDIELREDISNLGVLGDINEPLLKMAINDITGASPRLTSINEKSNTIIIKGHSKDYIPSQLGLYSDKKIPENLIKNNLFQ